MWSIQERDIIGTLDAILREQSVLAEIDAMASTLVSKLDRIEGAKLAKDLIQLELFGNNLPADVRACWLYLMRAPSATGAERHPNSHQRTLSFRGRGEFQTRDSSRDYRLCEHSRRVGPWERQLLNSAETSLHLRWVSIPPHTWHQAIANQGDWLMVSFHTATANQLIEEHPAAP